MKYIITESKLEETITNYIDGMFDVNDINWVNPLDFNYNEDENIVVYYIGDYEDSDYGCFKWYGCNQKVYTLKEFCPAVSLEHPYDRILNGYFGDMWHEPFKKWFTKHFKLPVKTVG
jgi:hypothetical protein